MPRQLEQTHESGQDAGRGNLLGIQPFMLPGDYASGDTLYQALDGYFSTAQAQGWTNSSTIVVLPEYLGTWLAASGEHRRVYAAGTIEAAMRTLAQAHPLATWRALRASKEPDRIAAAIFRMKASRMAHIYTTVFSALAKAYGVTIVAGSILLPAPEVIDGAVQAGTGGLQNVSAVFGPDGLAHPHLSRKIIPITTEQGFTTPGRVTDLPVFDTPAGRLGVLVCADSWYPEPYAQLNALGIDLLAVPSFLTGYGSWEIPWGGYNGALPPEDVDLQDVGRLTEGQAWRKYALAGRLAASGARSGMNVFLHGQLWDTGSDSGASVMVRGQEVVEADCPGAALLNLWL